MSELTTKRTLVKSPPELWAEVSDLEALAKHLGEFGEIRITRLEPETTVVWEGDRACGTVKLEPSGWGTKVTLTAELAVIEASTGKSPSPPRRRNPSSRRRSSRSQWRSRRPLSFANRRTQARLLGPAQPEQAV